jgi:hypothetical protein
MEKDANPGPALRPASFHTVIGTKPYLVVITAVCGTTFTIRVAA